jgi:hypothetical protein
VLCDGTETLNIRIYTQQNAKYKKKKFTVLSDSLKWKERLAYNSSNQNNFKCYSWCSDSKVHTLYIAVLYSVGCIALAQIRKYFWKNKNRLVRSLCCLCVCVSPLSTFECQNQSLWNLVYIYIGTWAHLKAVLHKSFSSVYVSLLCITAYRC